MTIADEALDSALHCEMVKYAYRQTKDGVVVSFVVHPNDIPAALSVSHIGARYMVALVQVGDDELPVRKEAPAKPRQPAPSSAGEAKQKMDWREVQPAAQAGIRSNEPEFHAFLREVMSYPDVKDADTAAVAVRHICRVHSRAEFSTDHRKRVLWHQLDSQFQAWQAKERVGV